MTAPPGDGNNNPAVIGGVVGGVSVIILLLVVVLIVVVVLLWKQQSRNKYELNSHQHSNHDLEFDNTLYEGMMLRFIFMSNMHNSPCRSKTILYGVFSILMLQ